MKGKYELGNEQDKKQPDEISEAETKCGIGWFSPKWLQVLASKKVFVVVYALAGMQMHVLSAYYVGTMSTTEKNFHMSTRMSGIITGAWDAGSLVTNLVVTYIAAKGHRTRWVALGMFLISISCFIRSLPYLIYGGGENVKLYTTEYGSYLNDTDFSNGIGNSTGIKKLSTNVNCEKSNTSFADTVAFYTFVIAQIITGMGSAVYWTCGASYLDDNARKNIVPVLLAFVQAIRLFGPTVGFLLSAYALKIYVEPGLTPTITSEDPRWIGAWWTGWYPIGIMSLFCAIGLALFPKMLPRAAMRKRNDPSQVTQNPLSLTDFKKSLTRIMKNKIIVFNSLSSTSFIIGLIAGWTFMPKYMESQFRLSPSKSNFLTGTVGILSNALGIMTAGIVISKLRPPPRFLAGWNVFVELLDSLGRIGYAWLSCPEQNYHGHWNEDQSWNLTETCNVKYQCGTDIQYNPVCDLSRDLAFYSPCHAGCTSTLTINNTLTYNGCSCVPGMGSVVEGLCPVDCSSNILIFVLMIGILSFTSATGRSCNTLIQFRCVDERDKSLSIGVTETFLALLAFMPAPVLYGILMDWTCMVWGDNCGSPGNCWIYNSTKLRFAFNFTASGFLFIGTILDCFVWYYVKDLQIYDEDFLGNPVNKKTANQALKEKFETNNQSIHEIELPLICNKRSSENNNTK